MMQAGAPFELQSETDFLQFSPYTSTLGIAGSEIYRDDTASSGDQFVSDLEKGVFVTLAADESYVLLPADSLSTNNYQRVTSCRLREADFGRMETLETLVLG